MRKHCLLCVLMRVRVIAMNKCEDFFVRTYSELIALPTFEERYRYLKLSASVGKDTFGFERYLNQRFYQTTEWKRIRNYIISRDMGRDLGVEGHEIYGPVYIHHLNPLRSHDIIERTEYLTNPEFLICTSFETHNAIHYGDENQIRKAPIERTKNDTCPWRK